MVDERHLETVAQVLAKAYDEDNHDTLGPTLASLMIQLSHVEPIVPDATPAPPTPRTRRFWLRARLRLRS